MAIYSLMKTATFQANGDDATALTGGAGSGGSICLAIKGELNFQSDKTQLHLQAMGGDNQKGRGTTEATHPNAQGAGGAGCITIYLNQQAPKKLSSTLSLLPISPIASTWQSSMEK